MTKLLKLEAIARIQLTKPTKKNYPEREKVKLADLSILDIVLGWESVEEIHV